MAASANSYFVPLKTFINQSHMTLMNASHGIQLRVFMDTQANCIIQGASQTGTAISTIIGVNCFYACQDWIVI